MLDTGSPVTMIDRAQIKRYGLRARADLAQTIDISGEVKNLTYTVAGSLKVGELELKKIKLGVTAFGKQGSVIAGLPVSGMLGLPGIAGLLGPDVLDKGAALIDCSGRKLYFRPAPK